MTRIFDALKKAEASRPGAVPVAPKPQPAQPAPMPASVLRGPSTPGSSRAARAERTPISRAIVAAALPEEIQREMSSLRVALESALDERGPRVVAFFSAQGGEGTSTVAAQFVIGLATDPHLRVLFMDVQAHRPAIGASQGPLAGLFLVPDGTDARGRSLDLMPVPDVARAAGLFAAADARALLDQVGDAYDWIVMDGPPVLFASDAAALGAVADGVVLVVEAGRTKKPVLTRAVDLLRKAGARVLGSVLNRRRLEIPEFIYRRI
jgi:Mrp family chromosome partitioning ATPase